jgi:DnaJ-class molecular chaperone
MARIKRKTSKVDTAYAILGVAPGLSMDAIHQVYKDLAIRKHPDHGGDGEMFARITMAFSVLKNTREKYDKQLRLEGRLNCPTCNGSGLSKTYRARKLVAIDCPICKGTGELS